jgi:hypothetical protein
MGFRKEDELILCGLKNSMGTRTKFQRKKLNSKEINPRIWYVCPVQVQNAGMFHPVNLEFTTIPHSD